MPIEFRGNTGAPIEQLFVANGLAIEIECSGNTTARLRSSDANGFAQSTFVRTPTGVDADGVPDDDNSDIGDFTAGQGDHLKSIDTDFDFNNVVMLTGAENSNLNTANRNGLYQGTFGHTTNFALSNLVTGVYMASINVNTSAGNCVFIGTANRD